MVLISIEVFRGLREGMDAVDAEVSIVEVWQILEALLP
jgi:hypothetical protein